MLDLDHDILSMVELDRTSLFGADNDHMFWLRTPLSQGLFDGVVDLNLR